MEVNELPNGLAQFSNNPYPGWVLELSILWQDVDIHKCFLHKPDSKLFMANAKTYGELKTREWAMIWKRISTGERNYIVYQFLQEASKSDVGNWKLPIQYSIINCHRTVLLLRITLGGSPRCVLFNLINIGEITKGTMVLSRYSSSWLDFLCCSIHFAPTIEKLWEEKCAWQYHREPQTSATKLSVKNCSWAEVNVYWLRWGNWAENWIRIK